MTAICVLPTKKALKEHTNKSMGGLFINTSMFGNEVVPTGRFTCCNSKRTWFAQVVTENEIIKKVS